MTGPVQVVVVGFEQPAFSGEVVAELDRLGRAGTVRLLDVLLLARAEDGTFEILPLPTPAPPGMGTLAAEMLGGAGPVVDATEPPDGSGWSLADAIPTGCTAAVALIEHLWATPLREAIQRSGGTALEETWLAREDVERLTVLIRERET